MSNVKKALAIGALAAITVLFTAPMAFAAGEPAAPAAAGQKAPDNSKGYIALAMGLGLGIAACGGAIGQGKAAAAALEGISRNPGASGKIMTPMILGLALIESLVIYSLVISFTLNGQLGQ